MRDDIIIGPFNRGILVFCAVVMLVVGVIGFQQAGAAVNNGPRTAKSWAEVSGMVLVASVAIGLAVVLVLLAAIVE